MKLFAVAIPLLLPMLASAQTVNVTIRGEVVPGVYGRVEIGNRPPPPLVQPEAVLIVKQPNPPAPIYMHVPPGHAKHWAKYCHRYNACNRPVYFVKSAEYEPGYRDHGRGHGHEQRQNEEREHDGGKGGGEHRGRD